MLVDTFLYNQSSRRKSKEIGIKHILKYQRLITSLVRHLNRPAKFNTIRNILRNMFFSSHGVNIPKVLLLSYAFSTMHILPLGALLYVVL